jgi:hypothetical protein
MVVLSFPPLQINSIRALRRNDGGYLVFVEEDYKGKSLVYHLEDPLESVK